MLFPLGDDNTGRHRTPYVVYGLIGVNVLVYLLQVTVGDPFTNAWAAIPFEIVNSEDLTRAVRIDMGGQSVTIDHYPGPIPIQLTLLSSMFMHGSLMHIAGNMLYLWIFGDQIEDLLGHVKFLIFYLVCGLVASAAHILFNLESIIPSLGASGAIAGVLGAYLIKYPHNKVRVLMMRMVTAVPAFVALGLWIVLQVVSQMTMDPETAGVAYMAHIGGFIAGVVLIFVLGGFGKGVPTTQARPT
jgi:membrane associated rhomboid family serine protease